MLITVAMPMYNGEKYIAQAIRGVLQQSHTDLELLIMDDASTDQSPAIAASFDDPRIRILRNPHNVGLAENHNALMDAAKGEYIFFNHTDDIMEPFCLERGVEVLGSDAAIDCVGFNQRIITAHGMLCGRMFTYTETDILFERYEFLEQYFAQYSMAISSALLRRGLLTDEGIRFVKEEGPQTDMALWVKLALCVRKMYFMVDPCLLRRIHAERVTALVSGGISYIKENLYSVQYTILRYILESALPEKKKQAYVGTILATCKHYLLLLPPYERDAFYPLWLTRFSGVLDAHGFLNPKQEEG